MARGTWCDFTSKWGFNEGASLEGRDFRARDILVRILNEQPKMKSAAVRAVPYNRSGLHNCCMILLVEDVPGVTNETLIENLEEECDLPNLEDEIGGFIHAAYDEAEESPDAKN